MKRWNGTPHSERAYYAPSSGRDSTREPKRKTKSEYTESVRVEYERQQTEIANVEAGKVMAHYRIVQDVYSYLQVSGESTLGKLSRELHISHNAVKLIATVLIRNGLIVYGKIPGRDVNTLKIK